MKTYCEEEIRSVVEDVLRQMPLRRPAPVELEVPVEISARHVHLTRAAMDALFGPGAELTCRRELSQPGQFLAQERLKLVTEKGEIANVAVLGPLRKDVQAELSATDARHLGLKAPVRLSGDLRGAGDVLLVGPKGFYEAKACPCGSATSSPWRPTWISTRPMPPASPGIRWDTWADAIRRAERALRAAPVRRAVRRRRKRRRPPVPLRRRQRPAAGGGLSPRRTPWRWSRRGRAVPRRGTCC